MSNIKTLFVGKIVHHFENLASTNAYALELLSKSNPSEGTVISAHHQQDGRGQIGSKWESAAGKNITLSVILRPSFLPIRQQFLLNQAVALAVRDCVCQYISSSVHVKWSNDIYIKDHKVAGILIQNMLASSKINATIVGIGLNVNQKKFLTRPPNPTSLQLETGKSFQLDEIKATLFSCLEIRYLQLRRGEYQKIQQDYINYMYRYMEDALYERPDGTVFNARILGLSPIGKLILLHAKGQEKFGMKEVKFII